MCDEEGNLAMNPLEKYYAEYHEKMGANGYTGDRHGMTSRFMLFKEQIEKHVPKGGRILDIGCGSATFAAQSPDYEWHGIDWDISPAAGKPITAIVHNVEQFPYPHEDHSFDAITCSELIEHCFDPVAIHKEVRRLLKREGSYFLSTPRHEWLVNVVQGHQNLVYNPTLSHTIEHIRTFTYDSHKQCLNAAGFVIDDHFGCDAHFDGILNPMAIEISKRVNERFGTNLTNWDVHLMMGYGHPHIQHTIFLRSTKA